MIIAMPMSQSGLASHFSKAQRIGFYNEYHQLINSFDNPALAGSCSDKSALLTLICQQKTDIVIVQNIGERMLGKLLNAGISVSKGERKTRIETLLSNSGDLSRRLIKASQGRASLNHAKKESCSSETCGATNGCGCSGHENLPKQRSRLIEHDTLSKLSTDPISYSGFRPSK